MGTTMSKLTILFEEPFWIGLYEREDGRRYEVCKITFGAEPKDYEVYDFLLKNWSRLRFSPTIGGKSLEARSINPKRMQRQVRRELKITGIGTKAQQALKLQQEQKKQSRQTRSQAARESEKQHQFELRREKRKEKHRGH